MPSHVKAIVKHGILGAFVGALIAGAMLSWGMGEDKYHHAYLGDRPYPECLDYVFSTGIYEGEHICSSPIESNVRQFFTGFVSFLIGFTLLTGFVIYAAEVWTATADYWRSKSDGHPFRSSDELGNGTDSSDEFRSS